MPEFRFDPPLTLINNIVVRNLDDAVRFMIGYREARRPALQTSVLHRVEGARMQHRAPLLRRPQRTSITRADVRHRARCQRPPTTARRQTG